MEPTVTSHRTYKNGYLQLWNCPSTFFNVWVFYFFSSKIFLMSVCQLSSSTFIYKCILYEPLLAKTTCLASMVISFSFPLPHFVTPCNTNNLILRIWQLRWQGWHVWLKWIFHTHANMCVCVFCVSRGGWGRENELVHVKCITNIEIIWLTWDF